MSSYIVEEKTINRILSFLKDHNTNQLDDLVVQRWISHQKRFDTYNEEDLTKFGRKLYQMNVKAVNQRYREKNDKEFIKKYKFKYINTSAEQVYNSIMCFTYQCAEGNVPGTEFYKQMQELEDVIAHVIANRVTDKANVEWG